GRRLAGRQEPHLARVAAQVVVGRRADHADEDHVPGGGHQPNEVVAHVLGADVAVDEPGVDPAAPQILEVHVPLDAVEVDVPFDGGDLLSAPQLMGDDAAPHV